MIVKTKLNSINVLISKALIDSNIGQDEFVLIKKILEKYDVNLLLLTYTYHLIVWSVKRKQKVKTQWLWGKKTEK